MNTRARCLACLAFWPWLALSQGFPQPDNRVLYTLLKDSYFVDDCMICARPTIQQPLRGTFELSLVQNTPPYAKYKVQNIDFATAPSGFLDRRITGDGTYERFDQFAILQTMKLAVQVKDAYTNKAAFFTNRDNSVEVPFPLIQVDVTQTNGTLMQTFSMHLLAAPIREIWFSTARPFTSTNRYAPTNQISAGDLISNRGRVVKRNIDLTRRLGVMPIVPDLGLDAVHVTRRGEILFSLPVNVWSERLGQIQHGDLLSNLGYIVKRNQTLLAAFHPSSTTDAGLDAVQVLPSGEVLFSIQSNVVTSSSVLLSRGDILSDQGRIHVSHQQLMANFHPSVTNYDFGLASLRILPGGEIWFSVQESFTDSRLGRVQQGDLLSNLGYRVFSNQDLLAAFAPSDPSQDYGLDALFVITDTQSARPPPRLLKLTRSGASFHSEWDGDGDVFQLERATTPVGPWIPCSEIVPELSGDTACDTNSFGFYRVRQW